MADQPDTEGKNLVELLDMLQPIPQPDAISMWPATQAWIWLALVLLGALVWVSWRLFRHWKSNAYRRAALAALADVDDDPAAIADILRRAALAAFPRRQVAGLIGDDWLSFLNETSGTKQFSGDVAEILIRAPYQEHPGSPELTSKARTWLKTHKAADRP